MTHQEEKNKERTGFIVSAAIHALFILLFFFIVVWRQPDPPTPGMPCVEINFGFDAAGSGDTNTEEPATEEAAVPKEQTEATAASEPVEATTSELPSEHVLPETKPQENTPTKVAEPNKNTNVSEAKPSDQKATEKSKPSGDGNTQQKGNQGATDGKIDSKGLYPGSGGNGNGPGGNGALSMAGWHLEADPKVDNANKEAGKVVFSIKIDEDGSIIGINVIEKQVSEALVQRCKDEINRMEFVKNRDNSSAAPFSTGTITFVFRLN
jgi:protein TonB